MAYTAMAGVLVCCDKAGPHAMSHSHRRIACLAHGHGHVAAFSSTHQYSFFFDMQVRHFWRPRRSQHCTRHAHHAFTCMSFRMSVGMSTRHLCMYACLCACLCAGQHAPEIGQCCPIRGTHCCELRPKCCQRVCRDEARGIICGTMRFCRDVTQQHVQRVVAIGLRAECGHDSTIGPMWPSRLRLLADFLCSCPPAGLL